MAGTFLEYFAGYLRVAFSGAWRGELYMDLIFHGDTIAATRCDDQFVKGDPDIHVHEDALTRTWISSTLCAFPALIAWLEAVTCGVQECAFSWDGEGTDGEMRWRGSFDSGLLEIVWTKGDIKREVYLNKVQMVRAFYDSFREYVESDRYDPLQYESLDAGECCELVLEGGDLSALADALAERSRREALALLDAMLDLAYDEKAGYPRRASLEMFIDKANASRQDEDEEEKWFTKEWDTWSVERRRRDVVEKVFTGGTSIGHGSRLRELRSPRVEDWLAQQANLGC